MSLSFDLAAPVALASSPPSREEQPRRAPFAFSRFFHDPAWSRWTAWTLPALVLVAWEILARAGLISSRLLPPPSAVLASAWTLTLSGELGNDILVSSLRAFAGFAIGASVGFALGIASGFFRSAEVLLDTPLQMVRNIPLLALVPLVIIWFGVGETAKVFLVAVSVFFPLYLNTCHGIRSVDPALVEMAGVYGATRASLLRDVLLRGALPSILLGVRYALGYMWLFLVVSETLSATSGIGYLAMDAREMVRTDIVLVSIGLYALLGKASDSVARAIERRFASWHASVQSEKRRTR
ncbi:sulfonate transport system permease protein [Verrucomicrobium sp. GAS474]|uniref:ABC transporter permease subunit n=1 Tax=Verrucomicrobium sp. GAS474 TaxID=1882831 RepID=UPI00087B3D0A|nr:ABC transporter permease subunit [Verrucomicrobium sp. GAS474]SDT97204.1 sulfonate transport system permease protein [Verrucomicrobium sp. GAS474]